MSLCLETVYLVLKNIRQELLPHHHVTAPVCQLIYVSLQNITNEVSLLSAGTRAASRAHAAPASASSQRRTRTTEDVHRDASLHLMALVRSHHLAKNEPPPLPPPPPSPPPPRHDSPMFLLLCRAPRASVCGDIVVCVCVCVCV